MCGIVAYLGNQQAFPILIKGLHRLEYRGYDSAGIAIIENKELNLYKCHGKVADLEKYVKQSNTNGTIGIAHTRWATHGEPSDMNAHPHYSNNKDIALIHNGIIENYAYLKQELINRGYEFSRAKQIQEVLVHLIDDIRKHEQVSLVEALRIALNEVIGTYAIVIISKMTPIH